MTAQVFHRLDVQQAEEIPNPTTMMNLHSISRTKSILAGVLVLVLLIVTYLLFGTTFSKDASYTYVTITRGNLESAISCSGTLSPVTQVEVGTQVSGIIDKVYADFNDRVHKGQIIALVDTSLLKLAVTDAESNLLKALAQYEEARENHQRSVELYNRGLISKADYQPVKTSLRTTEASLTAAHAAMERANRNLKYAIIRSPIDGTVTARNVEEGQTVAASFSTPTLFTIAQDLSKMEIKAMVDESDIGQIKKDQPVRFTVQAYPQKTFEGKVKQVRVQPTTASNVVNYTVVVSADNPGNLLLPGMTATVDFIVEKKTNVMLVPNAALRFEPTEKQLTSVFKKMKKSGPMPNDRQPKPPLPDSLAASGHATDPFPPPPDFGAGGPLPGDSQQERKPSGEMKKVYFLEKDGSLALEPILTGATDGNSTEILLTRRLTVGMQVISGTTGTTAKKSPTSQSSRGGMPGPGGPPLF
jgi:HlyD family secretion protein